METFFRDLKHSLRMFRQTPGFTAAAVAALTLGIGANTAIFSVVNSVLLKPLPFPDPDRIVVFLNVSPNGWFERRVCAEIHRLAPADQRRPGRRGLPFGVMNLTGGDSPEQLPVRPGDRGLLPAVRRADGARAHVHRRRRSPERRPGRGPRAMASGSAGSAAIPDGRRPDDRRSAAIRTSWSGSSRRHSTPTPVRSRCPDVWTPFQMDPASTDQANYFSGAARLKPGVTLAMANTQMQAAAAEFRSTFPNAMRPEEQLRRAAAAGAAWSATSGPRCSCWSAPSASCCSSPARTSRTCCWCARPARKREIAIRAAMGAGRGRIVRQLLTENVLLSRRRRRARPRLGMAGIRALLAVNPGNIPAHRPGRFGRHAPTGASSPSRWPCRWRPACVFGLFPALEASRADLNLTLKESSSRRAAGSARTRRARSWWSPKLLSPSSCSSAPSLLIRSFIALRAVNPGFVSHNVLTLRMSMTEPRFTTSRRRRSARAGRRRTAARAAWRRGGQHDVLRAARRWVRLAVQYRRPPARRRPVTQRRQLVHRCRPATSTSSGFRFCAGAISPTATSAARPGSSSSIRRWRSSIWPTAIR